MLIGKRNPTTPYVHKTYYTASWRESGRNWKCDEYKWRQSLKASGLNFWWTDQHNRGWKYSDWKSQSNPREAWFKSRWLWNIMSSGRLSLSWAIRWDERFGPLKSMDVPRLLRRCATWHKETADFNISWSSLKGYSVWKRVDVMYWSWENLGRK